ncbi:asialoglycoprotein receptor 1-like isoform X3 [Pantherophis guttatus]|uniref:Asialoglycoprotein receptor 1-like isoform X3 n=1 Tax=Pantherophis guttatus TaxID=94885 RepID=A0ABM3YX25_PANGU|nr:asialoglycoprotein receptor 1-like isoform X3 [Pantherophis guttatus]
MATSVVNMEASEAPTTPEMYENFQSANVEKEYEADFEKDFPLSKSFPQRVCPTSRLLLVLMVFCGVLILSVSILGIQGVRFTQSLQGTQKGVQNLTQTVQQEVTNLQAKMMVQVEIQLDTLEKNSRALHCEIIEMKSNGSKSGCCPRGWVNFRSSCYWTTQSTDTWQGAKKDCEDKKAHLVILNSADETDFVKRHRQGSNTWIGLTDSSGDWKWVDGSAYSVDPKDWDVGQPDHWYGHGSGGGEDCAHIISNGLWNDNVCSRMFPWVCEMELGI